MNAIKAVPITCEAFAPFGQFYRVDDPKEITMGAVKG